MEIGSPLDPTTDVAAEACPHCGQPNDPYGTFCTSCGKSLAPPGKSSRISVLSRVRRRLSWRLALLGVVIVALAAFATIETLHARTLDSRLASTRATLRATEAHLNKTVHALSAATALSRKRRDVLLQAQVVLGKVNPLLSSVDGLQSRAQSLQSDADNLSADAGSLNQTMITLVNYLLSTDTLNWDISYLTSLIGDANAELDSVNSDEAGVYSSDGRYGTASDAFGNKADAFSRAVLRLQKQLKKAVGP